MTPRTFISWIVLIALIYIGLWAFSAQQEIWSVRDRPDKTYIFVTGEFPVVHQWREGLDERFDVAMGGE